MKYITAQKAQEIKNNLLESGYKLTNLIEIAGFTAYEVLQHIITTKDTEILIVVGPGINGAYGLVIARWLQISEHKVTIYCVKTRYHNFLNICINCGIKIVTEKPKADFNYVIDAIFGVSNTEISEPYKKMIEDFNNYENVISIDVPSSYNVDITNEVVLFKPKCVITFIAPKICCRHIKMYVTRSFAPKEIFFCDRYTNYRYYVELENYEE